MAWASYFYIYEWMKSRLEETDDDGVLEAPQHMLCAYQAGLVTATLTNPIWVIKTRMMLQTPNGVARYRSTGDALRSIWRDEGFRGLYRGYAPALIGVAHGAVQFSVYEQFKRFIKRNSLDNDVGYFCAGAASKVVATVITYPYQVIRTRLQDRPAAGEARKFTSTWSTIVTTWRAEGVRGMYRGLGPGVLRVMPQSAIVFMVYERVLKVLQRNSG
jgi:solute carrier family 25 folate transporter 32